MKRREFLVSAAIALTAMSAYGFGQSIAQAGANKRTALIYGTRYGATRETAEWIAKGMGGSVELIDVATMDFTKAASGYDAFVIGSGIWIDGPHKRLVEFLAQHPEVHPKIIASFIVCGTTGKDPAGEKRIAGYLDRLHQPLKTPPAQSRHFGGRMIIDKLTEGDRKLLANFYTKILKRDFVSWDRTQPEAAKGFGRQLVRNS